MGSHWSARRGERRHPDRPQNGDTRPCPRCGRTSEFSERYRFAGEAVPAWVCDTPACREQMIVRSPRTPIKVQSRGLIQDFKNIRASARRTMMRSRARVERAEQAIDDSAKLRERTKDAASRSRKR
jgi:hypothetical protein